MQPPRLAWAVRTIEGVAASAAGDEIIVMENLVESEERLARALSKPARPTLSGPSLPLR
ncbi:hypothetical protein GCM10010520_52820 [Rhizobium viscosum]